MFAYPKQAEFNRVVPKSRIYTHAKASKRIQELFVRQVGEILWKYKLSPETVNLPSRDGINEIQVFEVVLKTPELDTGVLCAMDKAIPFPLVFQLTHSEQIRFAASYKRPSEADSSKWVIEASFMTEASPVSAKRAPLPVALDLASLYEQIVRRHIPLPARPGESILEHVERYKAIEAKSQEMEQLGRRLVEEKQFNRKVELNASLRATLREINRLSKS